MKLGKNGKPLAEYVNCQDKRNGWYTTVTIYGASHSKVVSELKKLKRKLEKKFR